MARLLVLLGLCCTLVCGQLVVPEALNNLTVAGGVSAEAESNKETSKAENSETPHGFKYHIESKTIGFLLDQIEGKIKSQHDKIMETHSKNQNRVKESARVKIAAAQKVLSAATKEDNTAKDRLADAAAKLEAAKAVWTAANLTRSKSKAGMNGAAQAFAAEKSNAEAEVKEATASNEEQGNEAFEILNQELKLVQTIRYMLGQLSKRHVERKKSEAEIAKEVLAKQNAILTAAGMKTEKLPDKAAFPEGMDPTKEGKDAVASLKGAQEALEAKVPATKGGDSDGSKQREQVKDVAAAVKKAAAQKAKSLR